jgi:hypothetical protein
LEDEDEEDEAEDEEDLEDDEDGKSIKSQRASLQHVVAKLKLGQPQLIRLSELR